jgi:hypothetical protein
MSYNDPTIKWYIDKYTDILHSIFKFNHIKEKSDHFVSLSTLGNWHIGVELLID